MLPPRSDEKAIFFPSLPILSYRIHEDESLMYVDVMLTEPKGFGVAPEPRIR
jgi:hypothetical protein